MKALVASPGKEGNLDLVDVPELEPRPNQAVVGVARIAATAVHWREDLGPVFE